MDTHFLEALAGYRMGVRVSLRVSQIFSMLALSCAVENGDAHLKNFAVVYEHAQSIVRLAPAYDIISTTPYSRRDVLALTLQDSKEFPDRKRLVEFGRRHCDLGAAQTAALLTRVHVGVKKALTEIRAYAKKHPDFARAAERFCTSFQRGLERINTAR